jgi:uncharacterized protein
MAESARSTWILGAAIFLGLAVAGNQIGRGTARFRADANTVTVKGLVEREVKSDRAVWTLSLRRASDDVRQGQGQVAGDRAAVIAFLTKTGFAESEIFREPTRTVDRLARDFGNENQRFRYSITSAVVVRTAKVDLVEASLSNTDELIQAGVVLDGDREGTANPRYEVSNFNSLRPQLLAEATKNARTIAQQFAADSGAQVGKIHAANQGAIQIFGTDGGDESGGYGATSTIRKNIRVVSTFEFELQ